MSTVITRAAFDIGSGAVKLEVAQLELPANIIRTLFFRTAHLFIGARLPSAWYRGVERIRTCYPL